MSAERGGEGSRPTDRFPSTVAGRFEVVGEARAGGMGLVLRARDRHAGVDVALKLVPARDAAASDRFAREAAVLAGLSHPGIVRYVAHGSIPGGPHYLAMEWVDGETVAERIARGRLTPRDAVAVVRHAAEAVAEAHARGVVHRDLKPDNLLLVGGDVDRVKVLDFGIALSTREVRLGSGQVFGTPGYVAPEQARGAHTVDARADVFALGCVLYECLTGRPAFAAANLIALLAKILVDEPPPVADLAAGVPPSLERALARTLAKDPAARHDDGAALAAELAAIEAELSQGATGAALPPAIRGEEVRIVSVLLAGPAVEPEGDRRAALEPLVAALAPHGAALVDRLADGTWVATLSAEGAAADQAARAARVALALKRLAPERALVLATGRAARVRGRVPVGDVLDRGARRLVGAARGEIGVCEVTAALLDARFDVRGAPDRATLAGEREEEGTRTLLGRPTPCVGRDRELATLEGTFAECASEPVARAVLVIAPPGGGKSRLLHELLHRLGAGPTVLLGRGDVLSAGSAFSVLAPALRRTAGIQGGEPLELRRQKLLARVARHVPPASAQRVAEFLGELCGVPFPGGEDGPLRSARGDAMVMGDAMRAAWEDFLAAECQAGPVVLVLEDLHWGDLPSVRFVDSALRTLATAPLFVLALARPEVETLFPSLWADRDVQKMRLAPLTRRAAERLVRQVLGDGVPADVIDGVVARAEGNAFYLEELIRAVSAEPSGPARGALAALPDTVVGTVQAHLDALPAEARRVLRAASVFGARFTRGGVAALTGGAEAQAGDWLDDLAAREVITRRTATEYAFRHDLVREAAYAMLPDEDRRLGHELAGGWLERTSDPHAAVLAEHFDRGGQPARAAAWYRRAAEQALGGNDLDAALASADRGIELSGGVPEAARPNGDELGALLLVKAEALRWRGDPVAAATHAELAARLLPQGSVAWYQAAGELIVSSGRLGRNDRVVELARVAAAAAPRPEAESAQVSALCRGAAQLIQAGLHAAADPILVDIEARVGVASATIDRLAQARVHRVRAKRALHRGDVAGFLVGQEAAAEAFELAGAARDACSERGDLGFAYLEIGDLARAEKVLRETLAAADQMGLAHVAPWAWNNLGTVLCHRGELAAAREIEQRAVDAGVAHGDRRLEGGSRINLSIIFYRIGDYPAAEAEARRAVDLLQPAPPRCAAALASWARALVAQGRVDEARAPAEAAMRTLTELGGLDEGESLVRLVHAERLEAAGDHAAATAALRPARQRLLSRAALISDPRLRESFLALPDNARTLVLAAAAICE